MDTNRLDKMEEMLTTLISMVGNMNDNQNKMDAQLEKMDARLDKMDTRLDKMDAQFGNFENNQSSMRNEILAKLSDMQADQDHIWEKAARNERELAKLKIHLQL
ncbi:hypothetical protein [Cytobacillus praedii]|uniref:hypothetical protein n=1 Tax=Cytobacillus praedii TaxID=1742358 RepID=UPI002E22FB05|nr:hypothetical protein [Cytobacillus praedii]